MKDFIRMASFTAALSVVCIGFSYFMYGLLLSDFLMATVILIPLLFVIGLEYSGDQRLRVQSVGFLSWLFCGITLMATAQVLFFG